VVGRERERERERERLTYKKKMHSKAQMIFHWIVSFTLYQYFTRYTFTMWTRLNLELYKLFSKSCSISPHHFSVHLTNYIWYKMFIHVPLYIFLILCIIFSNIKVKNFYLEKDVEIYQKCVRPLAVGLNK